MPSYLNHFHSFIDAKLPTFEDTFTQEDMVAWVQRRAPERRANNIRDHLLKRTTNYELRNNFIPPPASDDNLFFMLSANQFRRYRSGVDPDPVHVGPQRERQPQSEKEPPRIGVPLSGDAAARFRAAVVDLDEAFAGRSLDDDIVKTSVREWLDGDDDPLPWTLSEGLTDDEWFFITTLYGTMTAQGQRTHIRKFFPSLFVTAVKRDTRNFVANLREYDGLRSTWMAKRLYRMGEILRERRITMSEYVQFLRSLQEAATPYNPTPALDAIALDHRATTRKTLSVFIRDCVQCNCFPIDSRVSTQLAKYGLPEDERLLVRLSLEMGRNPRQIARMFYELR
jgi:hypothetical protein